MTSKNIGLLIAGIILIGAPCIVKAASKAPDTIKSEGNIFYESSAGSVRLYGEDIALLQEKLASVPEEIYDPAIYSQ